jgi:hypothetical protein
VGWVIEGWFDTVKIYPSVRLIANETHVIATTVDV